MNGGSRPTYSPFSCGKCVTWRNTHTKFTSPTPFNRFSSSVRRTVADHLIRVTDNLENVGQGQNLRKSNFLRGSISKKSPNVRFR